LRFSIGALEIILRSSDFVNGLASRSVMLWVYFQSAVSLVILPMIQSIAQLRGIEVEVCETY
jgi:hypothetical protein